jgi:hypothetical protein
MEVKTVRLKVARTADRWCWPWPTSCSSLSPLVFSVSMLSFSIFQHARPHAANSMTLSWSDRQIGDEAVAIAHFDGRITFIRQLTIMRRRAGAHREPWIGVSEARPAALELLC